MILLLCYQALKKAEAIIFYDYVCMVIAMIKDSITATDAIVNKKLSYEVCVIMEEKN